MLRLALWFVAVWFGVAGFAQAQETTQKIGVHITLSGGGAFAGQALLNAIQFAVDEANASGSGPKFALEAFDDQSTRDGAIAAARQAVGSDVPIVLGPSTSALALAACPTYAQGGLVSLLSTVHADAVTDNATTFRSVVSTGQIGEADANYLAHVLGAKRAIVLYVDNGYGQPLAARFKATAEKLGIAVTERAFGNAEQRDAAARAIATDPDQPPLILGMTYEDVVSPLMILRRAGYRGAIIGTATMARSSFVDLFAKQPEEQKTRGWFADGVYAVSPMILDSASAETLAFGTRFKARFGVDPSWESAQGYDGARLAMAALRATAGITDLARRRAAVQAWLASLNGPATAISGLAGPIWFADRSREQTVRMGRFHAGLFESAPLQIVAVPHANAAELASGAVFPLDADHYARLQRVVSTGVFINEITQIDLAKSSYGADFYLWLRYARNAGPDAADPTDIQFQNMVGGKFDRDHPAEQGEMADGTLYRLWRVQGDFRNDFDLHRYPFDQQALRLPFFNARAAADRVVYVVDRRTTDRQPSAPGPTSTAGGPLAAMATPAARSNDTGSIASPIAFRDLTQWDAQGAQERRANLVTDSALGDPRRVGVERQRELSGFIVDIDVERRALSTLTKTLLPMLLMTVIMYAALHFPTALVKEKITVAITAALSGAVLLAAINSQLGGIGYTIAVEYAFYVFFALSLLCVVGVMIAERQRAAGQGTDAAVTERLTHALFVAGVVTMVAGGVFYGVS